MSQMLPPQQQVGGAAGPQAPAPPPGPPPGPPGPPQGGAPAPDPMMIMGKIADLIQLFIQVEPDPQDKAAAVKLLQGAHDLAANRAKERDSALGMSPALKFVGRQNSRP